MAHARNRREREQAALRFARNRDPGRLEATKARLDAEAEAAVVRPSPTRRHLSARALVEGVSDARRRVTIRCAQLSVSLPPGRRD